MRKPIIAGNWKMNKTNKEAASLMNDIIFNVKKVQDVEIVVCPPYTALSDVNRMIKKTNIELGAQDVYFEEKGAFTSKVSAEMLKDVGCTYVIIGHSETRQYFNETDVSVNKKIKTALKYRLNPIICVGESLKQREAGKTMPVIKSQLKGALKDITKRQMGSVVIAYEPVWAIGTGKTATPEQAQEVHYELRKLLIQLYGPDTAEGVRILYGGSVKPDNVKDLMAEEDIDGGLIGGASLDADSFSKIVKFKEN